MLALRSLDAMPHPPHGYVGVDLILGNDPAGGADRVLEINPRLTTSYVGLRAAAKTNLAEAMLAVCRGECIVPEFDARGLQFDTEGNVSYV
jgi:hypothetical protein